MNSTPVSVISLPWTLRHDKCAVFRSGSKSERSSSPIKAYGMDNVWMFGSSLIMSFISCRSKIMPAASKTKEAAVCYNRWITVLAVSCTETCIIVRDFWCVLMLTHMLSLMFGQSINLNVSRSPCLLHCCQINDNVSSVIFVPHKSISTNELKRYVETSVKNHCCMLSQCHWETSLMAA